jgi:hypothetical protein
MDASSLKGMNFSIHDAGCEELIDSEMFKVAGTSDINDNTLTPSRLRFKKHQRAFQFFFECLLA